MIAEVHRSEGGDGHADGGREVRESAADGFVKEAALLDARQREDEAGGEEAH